MDSRVTLGWDNPAIRGKLNRPRVLLADDHSSVIERVGGLLRPNFEVVSAAGATGAGLSVPRLSVGKVGIEREMLDSVSGERLVAFVTSKGGRRWFSSLNTFKK
jgi:hypothetical protein